MTKKKFLIVMLLFMLVIAGCSRSELASIPNDKYPQDFSPSKYVKAQIFIDGTTSMQGYVDPGEGTNYAKTMQVLESTVIKGWPQQSVEYFKFGTKVIPISRYDALIGRTAAFYNDSAVSGQTRMDQIIDQASPNNLVIIVTDLFQNYADVNLLTMKLKDKYLAKGNAVGIIGMKSVFNGKVYDIGVSSKSFPYTSGPKPESYRPYYLLIMGPTPDVEHYIHVFSNQKGMEGQQANYLLMTNRKYVVPPCFAENSIDKLNKMVEVSNLTKAGQTNSRVKQFLIRKKDKEVTCSLRLNARPIAYTPQVNAAGITYNVTVSQLNKKGKFEPDKTAEGSMAIDNISFDGNSPVITCSFQQNSMKAGIYAYHVALIPGENIYNEPEWVNKWNMDLAVVNQCNSDPARFPGNLTLNLEALVGGLIDASTQYNAGYPAIGDYNLYIQFK